MKDLDDVIKVLEEMKQIQVMELQSIKQLNNMLEEKWRALMEIQVVE